MGHVKNISDGYKDNDNDDGNNHDKDVDNTDFTMTSKVMFDNYIFLFRGLSAKECGLKADSYDSK